MVRPGEVNLMTAGRGISHCQVSPASTTALHGAQLWVALPDRARHGDPGFDHHAPTPVTGPGWQARVFLGSLLGGTSPVAAATPLLGVELLLDARTTLVLEVEASYELGVLIDRGRLDVAGTTAEPLDLAYGPPGGDTLTLTSYDDPVRALLLGGQPFGEAIVVWWNFVGRSYEEVVGFREEWQAQLVEGGLVEGRYGRPVGDTLPPIPAPPMPHVRLKQRS